ncbi:hypothetical protein HYT26_03800 [Candidatus Pacearchaeota archaeon]|nr:hypothetical protein [Candidatus Pacearchaeota archaeon]
MAIENISGIGSVGSDVGNALSSNISQLFSGKLSEIWAIIQNILKVIAIIIIIFILYKLIVGIVGAFLRAREKRIMRNLLTEISENVKQINEKMDVLISRLGRQPAEKENKKEREKTKKKR